MKPAFIDYESFWDVKYTLRQMSTTDYVHDDRFEIHGASVALGKNDPQWLQGHYLKEWINRAKHDKYMLVGHHMLFDGYVTTHAYGAEFADYFCTMGMIEALFQGAISRGLDEAMTTLLGWEEGKSNILAKTKGKHWHEFTTEEKRYMEIYAVNDLRATQELFYQYGPSLPRREWEVMSTILKMFCWPRLEFDSALLRKALAQAHEDREQEIQTALDYFGITEKDLKGNNSFSALIESCDISMPMKPSPSVEGKMIPALAKTDQGFINLLEHDDPRIKALAEGRQAVKSTQGITRAQRFVDLDEKIGKLPVAYNYARAHTMRLTGANKVNLANLKRNSDLRKSVVAPKGFKLGVADSSQIEARGISYLAGNDYMVELFRNKEDPYNAMASDVFGRTIDRKNNPDDEFEGFIGKTIVLGCGFGMGGPKFKWTAEMKAKTDLGLNLKIPLDDAYRYVEVYRRTNWKIVNFWDYLQEALGKMVGNGAEFDWEYPDGILHFVPKENKVYFPNGTWLFYPLLSYDNGNFTYVNKLGKKYINKKIYGGLFSENIVQKFARDVVVEQMLWIAEKRHIVLHTYDENVALLPDETVDEDMAWMIELMKTPTTYAASMPLDAEGGYAQEYSK